MEGLRSFAWRHALLLIVLGGAVARFATLDTQSFWLDEEVTVTLVQRGPIELLESVAGGESNPALYYLLQGAWERVFGSGEVGIRSLSALAGIATIPLVYAAAAQLGSRRSGLIAAAITAASPLLVWYSQEARNYELFVLLAAAAFLCFVRALDDRGHRWIWGWALISALALCTHYFAFFLIVPELVWLAVRRPEARRDTALAAGVIGVVALALLPLLAMQRGRGSWIADYSFSDRLLQIPEHFLVGLQVPWPALPGIAIAVVGAVAVLGAVRAGPAARAAIALPLGIAGAALGMLLVAALAGEDYILSRNVIGLWAPLAVALGLALGEGLPRLGAATAAALCATGLALVIWTAFTPEAQRPDYDELAGELGETATDRLIVSQTSFSSPLPLYLDGARIAADDELEASELVVIEPRETESYAVGTCWWIHTCGGTDLAPPPRFEVPPGFEPADGGSTELFDFRVLRAPAPLPIERPFEYFTPRVFAQPAG